MRGLVIGGEGHQGKKLILMRGLQGTIIARLILGACGTITVRGK